MLASFRALSHNKARSSMLKPLAEQVIVITGASSGIGLASAQMASAAGAKVVLVARNGDALSAACEKIKTAGGSATYVIADVGSETDVERIARTAITQFGRIDTWVNNAGVDIWGEVLDTPTADSRRLFETNFWGVVNGCRAAAPHLREHGGALITVASVASDRAFPLQGVYCASKHAVKAYCEALRQELEHAGTPISVTLIKPSSIATPLQGQAKNFLPNEPKLPSPLYHPNEVARAVCYAAAHSKRDIYVGSAGWLLSALGRVAPRLMDIAGETLLFEAQDSGTPSAPRQDNLHRAGPAGGLVQDSKETRSSRASVVTRAATHPTSTLLALGAVSSALALAFAHLFTRSDDGAKRPNKRTH